MRATTHRLLLGLAGLAGAAGIACAATAVSLFEDAPRVTRPATVAPADIAAAGAMLRSVDARAADSGASRTVVATERQVDLLLDRVVRRWPNAAARVELLPGAARLRASIEIPRSPAGRWLNLEADVVQTAALPRLGRLTVGGLTLPGWLADPAARWLLARADARGERLLATQIVHAVGFGAGRAWLTLAWDADTRERLAAALTPPADRKRLTAYAGRLAALAAAAGPGGTTSLAAVLSPLFDLARQRSAAGDAAQENRAAILTLARHAAGHAPPHLTLAGREDFPQHLLISAALAIEGGDAFADAVGLDKEYADTNGGSGFSFNDIAADRAGRQLGLLALRRPAELQARLAAGVVEADFMPDVSDLPEFLSGAEFRRRYGGAGVPAYEAMLTRIEARVAALRLAASSR